MHLDPLLSQAPSPFTSVDSRPPLPRVHLHQAKLELYPTARSTALTACDPSPVSATFTCLVALPLYHSRFRDDAHELSHCIHIDKDSPGLLKYMSSRWL